MTIAAQLPASNLDIRGDRLRFLLANALNECEQQYRSGGTDKATNTTALLNAVITRLGAMTTPGSLTVANVTTDNNVTNAEAGSNITVNVTTANFADGSTLTVVLDGVVTAGVTISVVGSNAATITLTSAAATAIANGTHSLTVSGTDNAGVYRATVKQFTRSAS